MKKNIGIAILVIVVVVQSALLYRAARLSKQNTVTLYTASSLVMAAETQHQLCCKLPSQVAWLRRHLEKTIRVLEKEYHLEPMPVQLPGQSFELREDLKIHRPPQPAEPFATSYEPRDCHALNLDPENLQTNIGLQKLAALMELTSTSVSMANISMETQIDNFYQRLQRLEPLIETASK